MNYREKTPNITSTGAGKNYDGHRIFHTIRTGLIEYIYNDGTTRYATAEETARFKNDLTAAAAENPKVSWYLEKHPSMKAAKPLIDHLANGPADNDLKKTG